MRLPIIVTVFCLSLTCPALAQDNSSQHDTLMRVAQDFIVPGYENLRMTTKAEQDLWNGFCAAPRMSAVGNLKIAYQKASDAWSGVEFVHYGPIGMDLRAERMAHWPERRNVVGRGLFILLSRRGSDDLIPEHFAQTSAAVQGLSALERLLYDPDSVHAFMGGSNEAKHRCNLAMAIAGNLARISAQVLDEWDRPDGTLVQLEKGDAKKVDEALTRLATDYISLFETIDNQKLGLVMGKSIDKVRPTLAEDWRSGRAMRAIAVNLKAAEAMGQLMVNPQSDRGASLILALHTARVLAEHAPADIGKAAADPKERSNLVLLRDAVHSAHEIAVASLPPALGVMLGINSRPSD
ncbi:imelysin family protein [Microvirga sp. 2TAF3]|uniref:imelysin family protein n=1 Tax=Microvirga sp. 2TAF3 TaxID=3233014 RepID=UPI003F96DE5A